MLCDFTSNLMSFQQTACPWTFLPAQFAGTGGTCWSRRVTCVSSGKHQWHLFLPDHLFCIPSCYCSDHITQQQTFESGLVVLFLWQQLTALKREQTRHSAKKRKVGCLKLKALHKFNGPTLGSPRTQLTREKLWKAKIIPVCPSQHGKIHKWLQQRLHIRGVPSTEKKYEAIDIKKNTRITWRADYSTVEDLGLASSWRSLVFRNWGKRRAKSCQNGQYKLKHCKDIWLIWHLISMYFLSDIFIIRRTFYDVLRYNAAISPHICIYIYILSIYIYIHIVQIISYIYMLYIYIYILYIYIHIVYI